MDPTIGAALVSSGAAITNNALSVSSGLFGKKKAYEYNKKLQEQQNEYNQQMAERQNQMNRDNAQWAYDQEWKYNQAQWEREIAYNTPLAQMQRLKQAGLNPYMLNSDAPSNTASSMSTPDMNTPEAVQYPSANYTPYSENVPEFQLDSVVNKFFDAQLRSKQLEQMQANIDYTKQQTVNAGKSFDLMGLKEIYESLRNKYADDLFSTDLAKRYNINAKLRKELEALSFKLEYILPEDLVLLNNRNRLLKQQFEYNNDANPLRLKQMRFDNTYRHLRNIAQSTENKYLDDYFTLRNSNLTETNRQLWYANQMHSYGNEVLEDIKDNGLTMKNVGKLTRYYYLKQILAGVAPGVAMAESAVQPYETLMRPMNDMSDRFMRGLSMFLPFAGKISTPSVPQYHERERINPATGEVYYYERYR